MVDHTVKNVSGFENLTYLHAFSKMFFNVSIKTVLRMISMQKGTRIEKAVSVMNLTANATGHTIPHLENLRLKDLWEVGKI